MASIEADFLIGYKHPIYAGYGVNLSDVLQMEHNVSSAANAAVTPEEVEAWRVIVQQRGR
jgi:enoyl-CoA hydratase